MAVAILSTKSVNAMAIEHPSLKRYWFSDNNAKFFVCIYLTFCKIIFLGFVKIGIKRNWSVIFEFIFICFYIWV